MPNSWITKSDANEIRLIHPINRDGMALDDHERSYDLINDVRFQDADKTKAALVLKELLQEDLTFRQRTRDLPADDPDRSTNPVLGERLFWEGQGNNRELVSRSTIVESCVWDGERYVFELRRAR